MWGAKSPNRIVMQFCWGVDILNVITPDNFGSYRSVQVFLMAGGRISGFSIDFRHSGTTVWACDYICLFVDCDCNMCHEYQVCIVGHSHIWTFLIITVCNVHAPLCRWLWFRLWRRSWRRTNEDRWLFQPTFRTLWRFLVNLSVGNQLSNMTHATFW